jgi:hypothetical protein
LVTDEWAPYRDGRWIWNGNDYVWLSFESWGWVPYHFGRWAVVSGFGWCWVPPVRGDVYWGPGYVGWYRTGSQVGWTPLAPGEVFYGHKNYGRQSVNISSVNINTSKVVYRNRTSRGGLTILPQNDFLKGKNALQQPTGNTSVSLSVSVGSPRIQPLRESRMPIVRQTPPRVAPPQIVHRDSRELRDRFPRVAPAPAVSVPAAPSARTPQIREKKTTFPVAAPAERTPNKDRQQPQTTPPQRDERRQGSTPSPAASQPAQPAAPVSPPQQPARQQREERRQGESPKQAAPQPVPPVTQVPPPDSGSAPQRSEQPRWTITPTDGQKRPEAVPSRGAVRPAAPAVPATIPPQAATPPRAGQPRQVPAAKVMQPKKVWKVTTPESGNESDSREKDNRGKERRER